MKKNDLITPEGTRDLLFDECIARREAEQKLNILFTIQRAGSLLCVPIQLFLLQGLQLQD